MLPVHVLAKRLPPMKRAHRRLGQSIRSLSDKPVSTPPVIAAAEAKAAKQLSRLQRINARLPRFLQRWTTPLLRAPTSQIVAFLLLHEATAVVPLFGLVGAMHYTNWLPPMAEGAWVMAGVEKFGKYARRKGWLEDAEVVDAEARVTKAQQEEQAQNDDSNKNGQGKLRSWWHKSSGTAKAAWQKRDTLYGSGETGVRLLVEFATAWAIVKALIVPRLALSVWATPWFARLAVEPVSRAIIRNRSRLFGRSKTVASTAPK